MTNAKLDSSAPNLTTTELRHRRVKADESEQIQIDDDDIDVVEYEEDAKLEVVGMFESKEEESDEAEQRPTWTFSFMRLAFYALLFTLLFLTFIYFILPIVMPSCCDYRKDYLIFNEQNYNNDEMLPF